MTNMTQLSPAPCSGGAFVAHAVGFAFTRLGQTPARNVAPLRRGLFHAIVSGFRHRNQRFGSALGWRVCHLPGKPITMDRPNLAPLSCGAFFLRAVSDFRHRNQLRGSVFQSWVCLPHRQARMMDPNLAPLPGGAFSATRAVCVGVPT